MELLYLAFVELHASDPREAEANLREALAISQREGLHDFVTLCLLGSAAVAAVGGQAPRDATLLSAVQAALARSAVVLDPADQQEYDWCLGLVRHAMEGEAFAAA